MAKKSAGTRRRRRTGSKISRRRGGFRRRSSRGFLRGGFINKDMIKPAAGVVAGFVLPDMALRMLPASIQQSIATTKYGPMLAKAAIALAGGYFGRRFDTQFAASFAVGGLAAGGLDLLYRLKGMVGQQPATQVTTAGGNNRLLVPTGVAGLIDAQTGESLNGYIDDDGSVLNAYGQSIGDLYDGEENAVGNYDDDDGVGGFQDAE